MNKPGETTVATIETKAVAPSEHAKKKGQHPHRDSIEDPRKIIRQGLVIIFR